MNSAIVRSAGPDDEAAVFDVVLLAFAGDPFARWLYPDPAKYVAVSPEFGRAFGGKGFAHGSVDIVAGGTGAAIWLPPGVEPDGERMQELLEAHAPEDVLADIGAVIEQMAEAHPQEPCWYLPIIGVDPALHGRGLGAALLRRGIERADAEGVPAYLESSNPRNIGLYERHGFEILRTIQVGASPPVVPMLRRPR